MKRDVFATWVRERLKPDAIVLCGMGSSGAAWRAQKADQLSYSVSDPMGLALPFSLGLALAQPRRDVVLLDGDGDFCTAISALFAIAESAPPNLKIAVFNNRRYESGGGQPLPGAERASLALVARGAGLPSVVEVTDAAHAPGQIESWIAETRTALIVVAIDAEPLPYPPFGPLSKGEERAAFMSRLLHTT